MRNDCVTCGRPALAIDKRGRVKQIGKHELCRQCYKSLLDSAKALELKALELKLELKRQQDATAK